MGMMARIGYGSALAFSLCAWAQSAAAQAGIPDAAPVTIQSSVPRELALGAVLKTVEDPSTELQWLLIEDPAHPGGPGQLVSVKSGAGRAHPPRGVERVAQERPVIRMGDAVQVEEHSAVVDASLQAVALSSAVPGGTLRVRLRIGGRMLKTRALGPGRAVLEPTGGEP
jgi:hypothetical protein